MRKQTVSYRMDIEAWRGATLGVSAEMQGYYIALHHEMIVRGGPIPHHVATLGSIWMCRSSRAETILESLVGCALVRIEAGAVRSDLTDAIFGKLEKTSENIKEGVAKSLKNKNANHPKDNLSSSLGYHKDEKEGGDQGIPKDVDDPEEIAKKQSEDALKKEKDAKFRVWLKKVFTMFWESYPRKQGRKKAEAKFEVIMRQTKGQVIDDLLAGVDRLIASGTETQFIPLPEVWLNGERWNDEIVAKPKPKPTGYAI